MDGNPTQRKKMHIEFTMHANHINQIKKTHTHTHVQILFHPETQTSPVPLGKKI